MIWRIYIGFSILTFVIMLMQTYISSKRLKRKYPDIINEFNKNNKSGVLEKTFEYTKIFIICFIPIVNIVIFFSTLFKPEEAEERALNNMLKK